MPFMERLHSALILKTPMYHPNEAHIIEQTHELFYETIINNNSSQMLQMIREGFDVDFHELAKTPPLIFSIKYNRLESVNTLLLYGANVNIQDKEGNTPLHFALKFSYYDLVTTLVRYGADASIVNDKGISSRRQATEQEETLLKSMTSLVDTSAYNLFEIVRLGDLARLTHSVTSIQQLFSKNSDGQSLLHLAVLSNNLKTVLYLLNKALDIDAQDHDGLTPLILSMSHNRYLKITQLLLERHASVEHISQAEHSALSVAIRNNNPEGALLLIQRGANINVADQTHTPLTLTHTALLQYTQSASVYRQLETLLLSKGAKVDVALNSLGWTPLCSSVTKIQDKTNSAHVHLLLQLGANVNHIDINGRTPLMLAASMGRLSSIKILMQNYASHDLIDTFGWSALMFSVYYNHVDVVNFMLENGVDPNLTSPQGLTALKIAQEHKRLNMVDILLEFGAMVTKED